MTTNVKVLKFVTHSRRVQNIAKRYGWLPGARYTNLRDVKEFDRLGFLDIDWKNYDYKKHLSAAKLTRPILTVARDLEDKKQIKYIIDQAHLLSEYSDFVVIVPKDPSLSEEILASIPKKFLFGYSVPSKYGKTTLNPELFKRPVHLLGGRPDTQIRLAKMLDVFSLDCNRFTLDAAYGDFFDGETFRPHPTGGYVTCLKASLREINKLWKAYKPRGRRGKKP